MENSVESPQNIKNKTTIFKIRITTKKQIITSVDENVEKWEPLYIAGGL